MPTDGDDDVDADDLSALLADWGCPGSEEFPASYGACINKFMPDVEAVEACIEAIIRVGGQ